MCDREKFDKIFTAVRRSFYQKVTLAYMMIVNSGTSANNHITDTVQAGFGCSMVLPISYALEPRYFIMAKKAMRVLNR